MYQKCFRNVSEMFQDCFRSVSVSFLFHFCFIPVSFQLHARLKFSCSLEHAKRTFYMVFNAVYCKVVGVASDDVVLHLVKSKCMSLLLYGNEAIGYR